MHDWIDTDISTQIRAALAAGLRRSSGALVGGGLTRRRVVPGPPQPRVREYAARRAPGSVDVAPFAAGNMHMHMRPGGRARMSGREPSTRRPRAATRSAGRSAIADGRASLDLRRDLWRLAAIVVGLAGVLQRAMTPARPALRGL